MLFCINRGRVNPILEVGDNFGKHKFHYRWHFNLAFRSVSIDFYLMHYNIY
jgi:hypothetical protein